MSVATTSRLSLRMKRWLGPVAYSVAGAMAFARHPTFWARINTPAGAAEGMVHQVVIGNGRFYGGGVLVATESTLEDGMLDVYTLGMRGRWQLLRTMALLRFRVPLKRPGDVFLRSPTAFVETRPTGKRVNLDGEIRTRTPVTFKLVRKALRVLTPEPDRVDREGRVGRSASSGALTRPRHPLPERRFRDQGCSTTSVTTWPTLRSEA